MPTYRCGTFKPHVAVKFDRVSQSKLILDCFIDEETWGKQNTLKVQKVWYSIPERRFRNTVHGALPSGKTDRPNGPCTLICVSVAVGRTAVIPTVVPKVGDVEETMQYGNSDSAVDGKNEDINSCQSVDETKYDSVYHQVPRSEGEDGPKRSIPMVANMCGHTIRDADKVFPKYLIRFNYEGSDITRVRSNCAKCARKASGTLL